MRDRLFDLVIPYSELVASESQYHAILLIGDGHRHQHQTRIYSYVCLDPVGGACSVDPWSAWFNRDPIVLREGGARPRQRQDDEGSGHDRGNRVRN